MRYLRTERLSRKLDLEAGQSKIILLNDVLTSEVKEASLLRSFRITAELSERMKVKFQVDGETIFSGSVESGFEVVLAQTMELSCLFTAIDEDGKFLGYLLPHGSMINAFAETSGSPMAVYADVDLAVYAANNDVKPVDPKLALWDDRPFERLGRSSVQVDRDGNLAKITFDGCGVVHDSTGMCENCLELYKKLIEIAKKALKKE